VAPYRDDFVVSAECMFTWYWLADVCAAEAITFVLGHALAMKAIHGERPRTTSSTRSRSRPSYAEGCSRRPMCIRRRCDPRATDLALLEQYDTLITDLERTLVRTAKQHDGDAFHRLRSVPGIGKVLALTILVEIHDISRFGRVQEFASHARLVKGQKKSGGKKLGTSGAKMGNVHLKWAFSEASVLFLRRATGGQTFLARLEKCHGKGKALSILAHKLGRAVFYMLTQDTVVSLEKFTAA
jgi:transposase